MSTNLSISSVHTNRTVRHRDVGSACHIGSLTTAIDIRQDVTTADGDVRITLYLSRTMEIYASAQSIIEIWYTTGTATKHITIIGMTVSSALGSTCCFLRKARIIIILAVFRIIMGRIRVVWCVWCLIWPAGTFATSAGSSTYLTTFNLYIRIELHNTILTTTIDGALH